MQDPADIVRTPGLREQRQGDLRRVRGARARSAEHHLQPVLRVRELPRALHLHRPRARAHRRGDRPGGQAQGPGVRLGHRVGRHARRRRLPQGAVRRAHRRGRGARVPDAALQRVRRAQHPGHRRQARAVHPQRDEHRHGRGGVRRRHRRARRALRHARRAATTWWSAAAVPAALVAALDGLRALEHLQRAGGDQDREVLRLRARTTSC